MKTFKKSLLAILIASSLVNTETIKSMSLNKSNGMAHAAAFLAWLTTSASIDIYGNHYVNHTSISELKNRHNGTILELNLETKKRQLKKLVFFPLASFLIFKLYY